MKVKFVPQNVEYEIKPNQTVLQLAQENGLYIKSVCKGIPSCSECRINIDEGEYNVMPPSPTELDLIGTAHFVDHRRLACQLRCFGDITVNLEQQVEKENDVVTSKRPRGYVQKAAGEESAAVMGNIMHEEQSVADLNERTANLSLQEEETRRELEQIKARRRRNQEPSQESRPPRGEGRREKTGDEAKASSGEKRADSGKNSKSRSRRRNRRSGQVKGGSQNKPRKNEGSKAANKK